MEMNGLMGGLYRISEWIMRIAYINILWLAFTIAGLVFLGIFPATTGVFAVARKWRLGDTQIPIFKTFWKSYRSEFIRSNVLGYLIVIIGFILYLDLRIIQNIDGWLSTLLLILLFSLVFIYFFVVIFLFPVLVHFNSKTFQYLKNAIFVSIAYPIHTLLMLITSFLLIVMNVKFPILLPYFSVSILIVSIMFISYDAFRRLEEKENNY
ncbi:YesL family protein [Guptibacillus hwajinpoensis]|uniref:YesL family protein n=1 Tax=Guptibacillus hwajinpoensis TaxID=208199 RepID=UPI0024B39B00|nr:YesL family protein [Pseudalkalibacillus hwajinpoensis]